MKRLHDGSKLNHHFVFFSLGCKGIFLLGGNSRDDEPLAMFLRSGDVVLMAGKARECFHGKHGIICSLIYTAV